MVIDSQDCGGNPKPSRPLECHSDSLDLARIRFDAIVLVSPDSLLAFGTVHAVESPDITSIEALLARTLSPSLSGGIEGRVEGGLCTIDRLLLQRVTHHRDSPSRTHAAEEETGVWHDS